MLPHNPKDAFHPLPNPKTGLMDPYNLIATDRVRCMNCSKYFLTSQIQSHLMTHANQQFQQTYTSPPVISYDDNDAKPISLQRTTDNRSSRFTTTTQPIDVRTMTADELPEPEYRRRQIQLPRPRTDIHQIHPLNQIPSPQTLTQNTIKSQPTNLLLGMNIPIDSIRQQIQVGDYFEEIQLGQPQSVRVVPSIIALKRNLNLATYVDKDIHVDPAKVPDVVEYQPQNKNKYEVIRRKSSNRINSVNGMNPARSFVHVPKDNKSLNAYHPSRINTTRKIRDSISSQNAHDITPITQKQYNKNLSRTQRTKSGFFQFFNCGDPEDTLNQQRDSQPLIPHATISQYQYTQHDHISTRLNLACPQCGGFYCPVCKSTVPPSYRRPPPYTINRDYHLASQHDRNHMQDTRITTNGITPIKSIM